MISITYAFPEIKKDVNIFLHSIKLFQYGQE